MAKDQFIWRQTGKTGSGLLLLGALGLVFLLVGCLSYRHPTVSYAPPGSDPDFLMKSNALAHPLYRVVPLKSGQIRWYDAPHWLSWTFLGNEDDGIFGEQQSAPFTRHISTRGFLAWQIRNPAHNLGFYVLGSAGNNPHSNVTLLGVWPWHVTLVSKDGQTSQFEPAALKLNLNDYKPFFTFHFPVGWGRKFEFYLGWRYAGTLGAALRLNKRAYPPP